MKQYTLTLDENTLAILLKGLAELPLKESLRPVQIIEQQIIQQQAQQAQQAKEPTDGDQTAKAD